MHILVLVQLLVINLRTAVRTEPDRLVLNTPYNYGIWFGKLILFPGKLIYLEDKSHLVFNVFNILRYLWEYKPLRILKSVDVQGGQDTLHYHTQKRKQVSPTVNNKFTTLIEIHENITTQFNDNEDKPFELQRTVI